MISPNRVLVAGDWHGNTGWARHVIERVPTLLGADETPRIIVHCGDFGIWPGRAGAAYIDAVTEALEAVDTTLWFVDGNHEDFKQIAALSQLNGLGQVSERVWHVPRGHRWRWHGRTWLGIGGGVSVDKAVRHEGLNWWAEEEITGRQALLLSEDGHADVMVTHECPSSVPIVFPTPPSFWDPADLLRSDEHRERLQMVVDGVRPSYLIHGHLHMDHDYDIDTPWGDLRVTGLDCDETYGNVRVLDVRSMEYVGDARLQL